MKTEIESNHPEPQFDPFVHDLYRHIVTQTRERRHLIDKLVRSDPSIPDFYRNMLNKFKDPTRFLEEFARYAQQDNEKKDDRDVYIASLDEKEQTQKREAEKTERKNHLEQVLSYYLIEHPDPNDGDFVGKVLNRFIDNAFDHVGDRILSDNEIHETCYELINEFLRGEDSLGKAGNTPNRSSGEPDAKMANQRASSPKKGSGSLQESVTRKLDKNAHCIDKRGFLRALRGRLGWEGVPEDIENADQLSDIMCRRILDTGIFTLMKAVGLPSCVVESKGDA